MPWSILIATWLNLLFQPAKEDCAILLRVLDLITTRLRFRLGAQIDVNSSPTSKRLFEARGYWLEVGGLQAGDEFLNDDAPFDMVRTAAAHLARAALPPPSAQRLRDRVKLDRVKER